MGDRQRPYTDLESGAKNISSPRTVRPMRPSWTSMIRRLPIPAAVIATQLRHLIEVVTTEPRITIRVLPPDVLITGGFLPKASFSLVDNLTFLGVLANELTSETESDT